ncbi:ras guanine nucleotide exchange factor C [Nephila pilipes]|uniref:Ras guanine nucleotide exchange factor C n=1 Tax=Nephila pilipes TaxID=299642 RepID=A0A8X6NFZ0_NEPPI|nr:ras guanine nucleotide exchange factor C [Nephila pilipes]
MPTAGFFTDVEARIYAEQLTIADAAAFKTIDISELKNHPFEAELSTHLEHFTARFNYLSDWTVRTILAQSCSKRRAAFLSHFIDIAEALRRLRNVHSQFSIISALTSAPIDRLKLSWSRVPKSRRRTFQNLCDLLSWEGNFKKLREYMDPCHGHCIPYLGVFLKDVYGIHAAHPPREKDNELRLSKMEKVLSSIPFHQTVAFDHLKVWPNIQHLLEPCLELDTKGVGSSAFLISKELEP